MDLWTDRVRDFNKSLNAKAGLIIGYAGTGSRTEISKQRTTGSPKFVTPGVTLLLMKLKDME